MKGIIKKVKIRVLTKYCDKSCTSFLNNKIDSVPWISGLEFERGNSRVWKHLFLAASVAKTVHTDDQNCTTGHQWRNNYIQDYATVMYLVENKS